MPQSSDTSERIQINEGDGSTPIEPVSVSPVLTCGLSEEPASPSSERSLPFQFPRDAKGLAVQASQVATMILNNQIGLEQARSYSAVIRSVSQLISAEVARARAERTVPNLSLAEDNHA